MQRNSLRSCRSTRRITRAAATAVVVASLMSSCSSDDSEQAKEWQQNYCTKLGTWQRARNATTGSVDANGQSPESGNADIEGYAVISAAKLLDRKGLDSVGSRILDDTAMAVGGDTYAEGRAVSYCYDSGFETLTR